MGSRASKLEWGIWTLLSCLRYPQKSFEYRSLDLQTYQVIIWGTTNKVDAHTASRNYVQSSSVLAGYDHQGAIPASCSLSLASFRRTAGHWGGRWKESHLWVTCTDCNIFWPIKPPDLDGLPNLTLKVAIAEPPGMFRSAIKRRSLSRGLEVAEFSFIAKDGKPPRNPSAYRPKCLLATVGKVLERIILNWLLRYTEGVDGLSICNPTITKGLKLSHSSSTGPTLESL